MFVNRFNGRSGNLLTDTNVTLLACDVLLDWVVVITFFESAPTTRVIVGCLIGDEKIDCDCDEATGFGVRFKIISPLALDVELALNVLLITSS
jgi:hypothetical protein